MMALVLPVRGKADDHYQAVFHEHDPKTGKYVDRPFDMPKECDKMEEWAESHFGTFDMASIRLYSGCQSFCEKFSLLKKGSKVAKYDFVSSYDFSSLPLNLIPAYELKCTGISSNSWDKFCETIEKKSQDICSPKKCSYPLSYAAFILRENPSSEYYWSIRTDYTAIERESCRLRDGEFTGTLAIVDGRVRCRPTLEEQDDTIRLSLSWVEFRDMNYDDYMDAVVKVVEHVDGSAPDLYAIFILTRLGEDKEMRILSP